MAGLAQIGGVQAHGITAGEVAGSLKREQEQLVLVQDDVVAGEARDLLAQCVERGGVVDHVMVLGQSEDCLGWVLDFVHGFRRNLLYTKIARLAR